MNPNIRSGAYPTMITPYQEDRTVDYGAVRALVDWYWEKGCDGIFAACQSSEIRFLSLADRVKLSRTVKDEADRLAAKDKSRAPMSVVASGHISEDFDEQVNELRAVAETGVDAVVLISNRSDIENIGSDEWIRETEKLLNALPAETVVGTYECPMPYKRLLDDKMVEWIVKSGRFAFIKDTCCDALLMKRRIEMLQGSGVKLFNANGQTCLESLRYGADGYCGIMCNFHPELYVWLTHHWKTHPELADRVGAMLSMCAFTEGSTYPCTAKYYLSKYEKIPMSLYARSSQRTALTHYHRTWVDQMKLVCDALYEEIRNK